MCPVGTYQISWFFCHENARMSRVFLAAWELAGEKHIACVFIAISFVANYAFLSPIWTMHPACGR